MGSITAGVKIMIPTQRKATVASNVIVTEQENTCSVRRETSALTVPGTVSLLASINDPRRNSWTASAAYPFSRCSFSAPGSVMFSSAVGTPDDGEHDQTP